MGLQCSDVDLEVYEEHIAGTLRGYDRISQLVGPSLPVKYPRTPGYRPSPDENTLNGWYWKCDIKGDDNGKLSGKTIGIKDNVAVAGVPMMNGSKLLEGYVPEFDATVVTRILDAGGRILGKTNCEDLCMCGSSFTNVTGPTVNPHDKSRSSGGSSSGSAVLVAAGEIDMAIGGDQGGSIRIPASWCGIVGLKPTFGLVPYTGACPIEITIDHLGPMARNVHDCALLLEVISGPDGNNDPRQSNNFHVPEYTKQLHTEITGKKIALITEGFACCEQNVQDVVKETALKLSSKGALVEEVSIPLHKDGLAVWSAIALEGAYNCLYKGNERLKADSGMDVNCMPFNCTGHPAISINAGKSLHGLPVGMMIVGRHFDEVSVLQIAYAYEQLQKI
ncbi:hypothetical protein CHS0354_007586 [Potamilus streckersoni]|uniref:Amidase domain-containing protein n=1 Tax=Potamilus streckersoni TaxID=2493646 RepID=A0AAE0W6V0_9BIVA|nr:hypothetical protein CHS0354_007586 [Potamilus streckersoni]